MMRQRGQAALIVLMSMAIALISVLSILAASTTDIKLSSSGTESLRAFSAAEAGVENALVSNANVPLTSINGASYVATVASLAQGQLNYNFPYDLISGDTGVLWFVAHDSGGNLVCDGTHPCFTGHTVNICWGKSGTVNNTSTTPAIEITVFYLTTPGNYSTVRVAKATYDPNASRLSANSFLASDSGTCTIGQDRYAFQKQIDYSAGLGIPASSYNFQNGLQFMTVRMLYNSDIPHPLGFNINFAGNPNPPNPAGLPSQGSQVDSTGVLNISNRKVEVLKAYGTVPPPFEAAVFSPGGLSK